MSAVALDLARAEPAEAAAIRALVREAYAPWVPLIGREPMPMRADYERAIREHDIRLLRQDGELVALVETIRRPDHLFIENLAVRPNRQRRGLGRQLLDCVDRDAGEAGLPELRLLTNAAFAANIRLYLAFGFEIYAREPFVEGGETVFMRKAVTACD